MSAEHEVIEECMVGAHTVVREELVTVHQIGSECLVIEHTIETGDTPVVRAFERPFFEDSAFE